MNKQHERKQKPKSELPSFPKIGTHAYFDFEYTWKETLRFLHFVMHMAGSIDEKARVAHEALLVIDDPEKKARREAEWAKRKSMVQHLKEQRQFFLESILIRHVANYQNYISSLLFNIFIDRTDCMKSNEKVDLEFILSHNDYSSLVESIAERKVETQSYRSFEDMCLYFSDKFKLSLAPDDSIPLLVEAIETRNIIIHNRSVINSRYQLKTSCDPKLIGTKKELYIQDIERIGKRLANSVIQLDRTARSKLKLKSTTSAHVARARRTSP